MTHFSNQFAQVRFERTQPRTWRRLPFDGDTKIWPAVRSVVGSILLWLALFGLSLWSIGQGAA